ncbi:MAG TPA: CvpA family protein [Kiritimatiellia bacterium]|nr:CvpA family protein [Kiritimatiellia bacterium]HRU70799.1 CvpA family protein [Kiritimatiellia bacterium]
MPAFVAQMSLLDYLAFSAVAWLVIRGFLRGCSGEISGLVGLLSAAVVGYFGFAPVERTVQAAQLLAASPYAARLITFLLVLVACFSVWLLIGRLLKEALQLVVRQPFDALLGGIIGGVKAFVAIAALCALGLLSPSEADRNRLKDQSLAVKELAPFLHRITTPAQGAPNQAPPRKREME